MSIFNIKVNKKVSKQKSDYTGPFSTLALFLIMITLLNPLSAHAQDAQNQLRGYTAVNQAILERVAQVNGFELGQYLSETAQIPNPGDLLGLLGTYVGSDTSASYRNGDPDSVNMLLWYIAINKLAVNIANDCDPKFVAGGSHPLLLQPTFQTALTPLCAWPATSAQNNAALYGLWSALLGFDAPPAEFQAWENYFLTEPSYQTMPAKAVISDMVTSALYNPYFLLAD